MILLWKLGFNPLKIFWDRIFDRKFSIRTLPHYLHIHLYWNTCGVNCRRCNSILWKKKVTIKKTTASNNLSFFKVNSCERLWRSHYITNYFATYMLTWTNTLVAEYLGSTNSSLRSSLCSVQLSFIWATQ